MWKKQYTVHSQDIFFIKYFLKSTQQNVDKPVPSTFTNVFLLPISIAQSAFLQWIVMFLFFADYNLSLEK